MTTILAAMSDTHCGYTMGLIDPDVDLQQEREDGTIVPFTPELTEGQKTLHVLHTQSIAEVSYLTKKHPGIFIHDGDITHGNKYMGQLVTTRIADQILIALSALDPWFRIRGIQKYRFATGTEVHVFGEASAEVLVCNTYKQKYPKRDIEVVKHGRILLQDEDNIEIDYAHHGPPPGTRPDLRGNSARAYLKGICATAVGFDERPPRLVLRGHYHVPVEETVYTRFRGGWVKSTIFLLPSFTFPDHHTIQAARSEGKVTVGMMIFTINGDEIEATPMTETVDITTKEIF